MLAKILVFFICSNICLAHAMHTNNIEDIKNLLNKEANKETLVIFDVDDVLIAPTDEFAFTEPIRKKLNKELKEKYSKDQIKLLFSDFFRKRTVKLVNSKITELIKQLESNKIPTTALTGWWTGRYGNIPHMEVLRFKGLDDTNISFANISPFKEDTDFPELKTEGGIPMIRNGIILTALADKGDTLLAVLSKTKSEFKKIIFIDDDLSQIESVKKACQKIGIDFIGIHYTEANLIPLPKLNETMEKLRFEILEKEHVWLLDTELKMRVDKQHE